jgi:hypothetical protein
VSASTLDKTFGNLRPHWATLAAELKDALLSARNVRIDDATAAGGALAQLRADNGRETRREHGRASVVPLLRGSDDAIRYWLSYAEEWEEVGGTRPYRFRSSNLTFFFLITRKPQPV